MIVRVFNSAADRSFGAVDYNDEKIEKGHGELVGFENFPDYVDRTDKESVRQYFQSVSPANPGMKNVQFHAVISAPGKQVNKETLKLVADDFMKNLGYGDQPYIAVFHGDTKNNHIHLVSTNVNPEGKRIANDFKKLNSQKALIQAEKNILGIDYRDKVSRMFDYKFQNISQFEKLLERNGFASYTKDGQFFILKNNIPVTQIAVGDIPFQSEIDEKRAQQIEAYFKKYSAALDNNVFAITRYGNVIDFKSQLQVEMKKKFGVDIVFSYSGDKQPFGYTVIDNKTKSVFKGSDIADMKNFFNFTDTKVDHKVFALLENSLIKNDEMKLALEFYLLQKYDFKLQDFLLNFGSKVSYSNFKDCKNTLIGVVKNDHSSIQKFKENYTIVNAGDQQFIFNNTQGYCLDMKDVLNEKQFSAFQDRVHTPVPPEQNQNEFSPKIETGNVGQTVSVITDAIRAVDTRGASNTDQDQPKRKRKRRR